MLMKLRVVTAEASPKTPVPPIQADSPRITGQVSYAKHHNLNRQGMGSSSKRPAGDPYADRLVRRSLRFGPADHEPHQTNLNLSVNPFFKQTTVVNPPEFGQGSTLPPPWVNMVTPLGRVTRENNVHEGFPTVWDLFKGSFVHGRNMLDVVKTMAHKEGTTPEALITHINSFRAYYQTGSYT